MIETHSNLWIASLDLAHHLRTCGYWFTVTKGAAAHTAFKTREGLILWLHERGLKLCDPLPAIRVPGSLHIKGQYRTECHFTVNEVTAWYALRPVIESRTLSNGDYVEAKITEDADGIRTVHTLNPNIRSRHVFDYHESDKMMS